ncbi:hypothetical protein VF04_04370 [Nostoc linckia z7]|uniref:Uncharacterized protein n=2 Tax=Nostoc linckia TaxID=92942 RepID=A0A9Q5ZG44_NOSLI|nr:hypothetical protein [Nostoc linckia]PHK42947.1 hypothetical protein VF12_01070 [Nostoc linckia z15]PHK48104.1 hypothetical protein VF13_02045 [Nostoc linckia z16]PHJ65024.1 hypothetical protein VF02_11855 [Nostoc linckia z1]PHJ70065.1 hypothetical protein VF05_11250 [Nostoc linckia z3]PHJ75103.1 hypothetical protein VF03_12175 [Nostoc linckia z2]
MNNKKYRNQIADLILKDEQGNDLVVLSNLERNENGSMFFVVGSDESSSSPKYKVTIQIEEI